MTTLNPTSAPADQQTIIDTINSTNQTLATNPESSANPSDFNIGEFATGIFNDYLHQNWAVNYGALSVGGYLVGKSITQLVRDGLSLKDLKTFTIGGALVIAAGLNRDDTPNTLGISNALTFGGSLSGALHSYLQNKSKVKEPTVDKKEDEKPPVNNNEKVEPPVKNLNDGDDDGDDSDVPPGTSGSDLNSENPVNSDDGQG